MLRQEQRCVKSNCSRGQQTIGDSVCKRDGREGLKASESRSVYLEEEASLVKHKSWKWSWDLERKKNAVVRVWMRALCAYVAFIDPSGGKLEEFRARSSSRRHVRVFLQLLWVNNLLNELSAPGVRLNVSIVCALTVLIVHLLFPCISPLVWWRQSWLNGQ